jgi:hypothetical protein
VANPDVAGREDVEEKAPQELDLTAGLGLTMPGAEGDGTVADPEQAVIADADAVGIASKVLKDMLGTAEGRPGVDDPTGAIQLVPQGRVELSADGSEKLAAKEGACDLDGEEIIRRCREPALPIRGEPAPGDDTVQMGMYMEFASPGVQDGGDAELSSQPAWIAAQLEQSTGCGLEQRVEEEPRLSLSQTAKLSRQGEGDVEVVGIKQAIESLVEPALGSQSLTLGAMSVAAGVIGRALELTAGADVEVTPSLCGATASKIAEDALLPGGQRVALGELVGGRASDGTDLVARSNSPRAP